MSIITEDDPIYLYARIQTLASEGSVSDFFAVVMPQYQTIYLIINLLAYIPFLYFAFSFMRRTKFSFKYEAVFSLFFCISKVVSGAFFIFIYFNSMSYHFYIDSIIYRLYEMPNYLTACAQTQFFNRIANILVVFSSPGGKIFYLFSLALYVASVIFMVILFALTFVKLPPKAFTFLYGVDGFVVKNYDGFLILVLCIDVYLLSHLLIFSKTRDYFPPKYRTIMLICMFLLSFSSLFTICIFDMIVNILSKTPGKSENFFYKYWNLIYLVKEHFIDLVMLAIIWIMSHPEYNEQEEDLSNIGDVLNESIVTANNP